MRVVQPPWAGTVAGTKPTLTLEVFMSATATLVRPSVLDGDRVDWCYAYDTDHAAVEREDALVVVVYDTCSGATLASLGGVTVESLQISDHGNVNVSPADEAYLRNVAGELAAEL